MPKKKLYLKDWAYLGIHSIKPIEKTVFWDGQAEQATIKFGITKHGRDRAYPTSIQPIHFFSEIEASYNLPATHALTLCSNQWNWCFKAPGKRTIHRVVQRGSNYERVPKTWVDGVDLSNPDQDACMIIWTRCKILNRHPGSSFIYYDDHIYHILTWLDVLGRNNKDDRFSKIRNKRIVLFINRRTPEEAKQILELYEEEKPEYRKHR